MFGAQKSSEYFQPFASILVCNIFIYVYNFEQISVKMNIFISRKMKDNCSVYEATTEVPPSETRASFGSSFEEVEDSLSSFTDSDSSSRSEKTTYNSGCKQLKPKRFSKAIRTLKQRYRCRLLLFIVHYQRISAF